MARRTERHQIEPIEELRFGEGPLLVVNFQGGCNESFGFAVGAERFFAEYQPAQVLPRCAPIMPAPGEIRAQVLARNGVLATRSAICPVRTALDGAIAPDGVCHRS